MLDPEIQRLAEAKIAADIREHAAVLRAEVGKAVAELASRGILRSSVAVRRMSDLCTAEMRRRGAAAWQGVQTTLRAVDIQYDDSLAHDLKQIIEHFVPERPGDLLGLISAHAPLSGFPEMITGIESSVRSASILTLERLGAEIDIFVMSLKHGQKRTGTSPDKLETDGLTGLYRREAFEKRGPELIETAKKNCVPLSLLMMDVDHFKTVNDKYGHQRGDEVLTVVGGMLRKAIDCKGEGYRWGGDEFGALLPNFSPEEAVAMAERVRREVETVVLTEPGVKITVSIGIASFPDHGQDHVDLHGAADKALYDAKHQGRNLVRLYGEPPPSIPGKREPKRREPEPGGLTDETKRKIREDYFKTRVARCPEDGAVLEILEAPRTFGQRSVHILARCPLCGIDINLPGAD